MFRICVALPFGFTERFNLLTCFSTPRPDLASMLLIESDQVALPLSSDSEEKSTNSRGATISTTYLQYSDDCLGHKIGKQNKTRR